MSVRRSIRAEFSSDSIIMLLRTVFSVVSCQCMSSDVCLTGVSNALVFVPMTLKYFFVVSSVVYTAFCRNDRIMIDAQCIDGCAVSVGPVRMVQVRPTVAFVVRLLLDILHSSMVLV